MIVPDTSVWSLAFRRRRRPVSASLAALRLRQAVLDDEPVLLLGIVFQELLSGVRDAQQERRLQRALDGFPLRLATQRDHLAASRIFSACVRAGVSTGAVDCLIAAQCVGAGAALLTTDRDFERIARHSELALVALNA